MDRRNSSNTMRIKLSDERRDRVVRSTKEFFAETFDEDLSAYRAERIVDFFTKELGPPVYNQAIRDAHGFIQKKLSDLEGEFYEPDEPYSR